MTEFEAKYYKGKVQTLRKKMREREMSPVIARRSKRGKRNW